MRIKKASILSLIIVLSFFTLAYAQKKRPPRYSLKDLSDSESPSYVPYPFPKSSFEILEDFKYYVVKTKLYEEPGYEILMPGKGEITIDNIIKVRQRSLNFPHDYYYIFHIKKDGQIIGINSLDEFGIALSGYIAQNKEQMKLIKPFKRKEEVQKILNETLGPVEIKKMEQIHYISDICRLLDPLWEAETSEGTYYIDNRGIIWTGDGDEPATSKTQVTDENIRFRKKEGILDEERNIIRYLKKVNAKKN